LYQSIRSQELSLNGLLQNNILLCQSDLKNYHWMVNYKTISYCINQISRIICFVIDHSMIILEIWLIDTIRYCFVIDHSMIILEIWLIDTIRYCFVIDHSKTQTAYEQNSNEIFSQKLLNRLKRNLT
jgi:hypothetical protein